MAGDGISRRCNTSADPDPSCTSAFMVWHDPDAMAIIFVPPAHSFVRSPRGGWGGLRNDFTWMFRGGVSSCDNAGLYNGKSPSVQARWAFSPSREASSHSRLRVNPPPL